PACVQAIGRNENGAVLRQLLQTEMGHVVAIRSAAIDFFGVAAIPMKTEDQPIGMSFVVVVGQPHGKAAIANLDVATGTDAHGLPRLARDRPERQRRSLVAAGTPADASAAAGSRTTQRA